MDSVSKEDTDVILEAGTVYLLMKKGFPISRNVRAQWILEHLDSVIKIPEEISNAEDASELEILSIIPKNDTTNWTAETSHRYYYKITSKSSVVFLAHKYRMVFCLDLSPSLGTIDIQRGEVVIDEVCTATKQCLENVSKPFPVPGSKRIIRPEIYVTIIVHSPFFTNPAQQVLVQGWLINSDNINKLIQFIEKCINCLEENIANAEGERFTASVAYKNGETSLLGMNLNSSSNSFPSIPTICSEASFINMLRYGMLALALLPEHSCAHLVIVSDGIVGISDVYVLESLTQQLRSSTIACSFLHIGSAYHPHCANGLVPYQELLRFLASATLGCYMSFIPQIAISNEGINIYHKNFLCWQLYRSVKNKKKEEKEEDENDEEEKEMEKVREPNHYHNHEEERDDTDSLKSNSWQTSNALFYGHQPQLLRKKQLDNNVTCSLNSLLCCRLRDGYLIKRIGLRDNTVEICFILPWKTHVFLEYLISTSWPPRGGCNTIHYTITVEAPYDFLHDITCLSKKPLKSQYRQNVISRFWTTLTGLTENDTMLEHFSWFPEPGWTWYNVSDTIRSGMPVFYLPTYPLATTVQLSDAVCPQFGKIWKPVASLDSNQWARWMHSQRITLILTHDRPLPKYLHQANQSGRFQNIQSRQAAAVLYAMLKNWATFVLVENHTYVQFIYRESEKPPVSFSVIRINCKALCVVLHVAFAGGTEGVVRHNVVMDLIDRLSKLTLPNRPIEIKDTSPCTTIIHKSLEKILVRYEKMPSDFNTIVFPDGTQPTLVKNFQSNGALLTTTLSRYLHHFRWLWNVRRPFIQTTPEILLPKLNITAIARILSTITKIRLNEGFNFAYSAAGIINMVLEVQMKGSMNDYHPCMVQYIIFPPHTITNPIMERDSQSETDNTDDTDGGTADGEEAVIEENENSGDYQIVVEVWIEPQCGRVVEPGTNPASSYMENLAYHQFPQAISIIDEECINALLTLEHLSLLTQVDSCESSVDLTNGYQYQNNVVYSTRRNSMLNVDQSTSTFLNAPPLNDESIEQKLFNFNALSILPKCQQAELLFSMFAEGSSSNYNSVEDESQNTNSILLEGLMDHMKRIHSKEINLTDLESEEFTKMLFSRPRENSQRQNLPFSQDLPDKERNTIRWRCFIKGVSTTHVILSILPASERDIRMLTNYPAQKLSEKSKAETVDVFSSQKFEEMWPLKKNEYDKAISSRTAGESTPIKTDRLIKRKGTILSGSGSKQELILPVYVYDCSLALLIDVIVGKLHSARLKDIYQDNTFSVGENIEQHLMNLNNKTSDYYKCPSSPEPKSEDSESGCSDQKSLLEHCKLLNLAHCHCFVVAVYKSLSLQLRLSYEDMEAAVEQCEESLIEINISDYLKTVCKHGNLTEDIDGDDNCIEFKPLHNLIRDKFRRIIQVAFKPVPAHSEFYYYSPMLHNTERPGEFHRSDSEDDIEEGPFTFPTESPIDSKLNVPIVKTSLSSSNNSNWHNSNNIIPREANKLSSYESSESLISDIRDEEEIENICKEHPLFLQLNCSIHSKSSFASIPVKVLPTCFDDIKKSLEDYNNIMKFDNAKITLDIICLYLPKEVLEVSASERLSHTLRTTSYCSASPVGSLKTSSTESNNPANDDVLIKERIAHLPSYQHEAISTMKSEIEWLLKDEIATALLDNKLQPTDATLDFVAKHVSESNGRRSSCHMDKVPLQFVFSSANSAPKFHQELMSLVVNKYKIEQLDRYLYFVKDDNIIDNSAEPNVDENIMKQQNYEKYKKPRIECTDDYLESSPHDYFISSRQNSSGDPPGYNSEISSTDEGHHPCTDDGYDGDSSNSEDDCCWLMELEKRRHPLPNFWLILQVHKNHVNVYFHCRFLDFSSPEVDKYRQIQKMVVTQISAICKRVNQYLLLESLHDTRNCDPLLEPESNEDHSWNKDNEGGGNSSSEIGLGGLQTKHESIGLNMLPGMFRCSVVWEVPFHLHPRLKTGPGRSGLSRGIKALHVVLNRFSVNNRSNMFVYRENNSNVFYLRLHEQTGDGKPLQNKLSESDEKLMVSRSSSVASLSQSRIIVGSSQSRIDDTRPRVRSFGEKDSDYMNKSDDSILLMVHGISEPGVEVKQDLVQVLQNRLDDAILEVLSVMLARNPMCKLTPADVHFIQKPYRPPESYVQFSIKPYYFSHMEALSYYLRQNILQFLYIPKYTDPRAHYHFQDYSQPEDSTTRVAETDIFLSNQSQSSGNKGIACIAMAIINETIEVNEDESRFPQFLSPEEFKNVVLTNTYQGTSARTTNSAAAVTAAPIEFRIWKQGRVNLETLIDKLRGAIKHANWDLVVEYLLLPVPLTTISHSDTASQQSSNDSKLNSYELGEEGQLHEIYHKTLPYWFQFALDIGVSSVKKHIITIEHRHTISTIVREIQNLIKINAPETSTRAFALKQTQPFVIDESIDKTTKLSFRVTNGRSKKNNTTSSSSSSNNDVNIENAKPTDIVYIPCEFGPDDHEPYKRAVIVARNFSQWKASCSDLPEPESLIPKDQKLLQKFNPYIQGQKFIPRQRLLLAQVESHEVVIYIYNWSKERSEKLLKQINHLTTWLSSRSALFSNIVMQKLGIFHHKLITNHYDLGDDHNHNGQFEISDVENLTKFPLTVVAENTEKWSRRSGQINKIVPHYAWHRLVGQIMRDAIHQQTSSINNNHHSANTKDPVMKILHDLKELHQREKKNKEDLTRLYSMWQSRSAAPSIPMPALTIQTFKQNSRLIHYCYTPILFLPQWRIESAATRDHSLTPPPLSNSSTSSPLNASQSKMKKLTNQDKSLLWHQELCTSMFFEYKQYLQLLGFNSVQIDMDAKGCSNCDHDSDGNDSDEDNNDDDDDNEDGDDGDGDNDDDDDGNDGARARARARARAGADPDNIDDHHHKNADGDDDDPRQVCYLKKSMLGGILLFEIQLTEPFFVVKLHAIESNRLQTKSCPVNHQFMMSFVDACDKIKINMHLHSFTYDFHLRCIHSYIAGTCQWSMQQGYHLTHFLEDFIKYYSKAPNFARNLVYSDTVNITNLTTPAHTLFSYLLSHEKSYGMQVFGMTSDSQDTRDSEYVLVKLQSTPLVSYCDAQDTKYTDDFTVVLIVSKIDQPPQFERTEIRLKFYLILTSKRELYPKREVENNKLGKFRTVYSVVKTATGAQVENFLESDPTTPISRGKDYCATPTTTTATTTSYKNNNTNDNNNSNHNDDNNNNGNEYECNDESTSSSSKETEENNKNEINAPTPPPVPNSPLMVTTSTLSNSPESSPNLMQIRRESINYFGYYSSHEQLMQQLIIAQAKAAKQHITNMIERGTLHCRTHLLWNKLLENKSSMNYAEFMELKSLAKIETLSTLDARLSPLVNQPITWYQSLAKVLQNKYQEHHKQFSTADGNVTHHLILHPSYLQAFMMLTIDLHTSRGELYAVYRKSAEITSTPFNLSEIHSLIEGFVNACCFHLWIGLYTQ